MQIALLLVTLVVAVVLFSWERLPADVCALGILLFLVLTGLLPAKVAFAGFGSEAVVMVMGLLILMGALERTGATDFVGRAILRWAGTDPNQLLLVMMVAAMVLSAFMSNTAATAFLLPVVSGLATRARVSRAKLLLPLAFASILSSSITLVSTSTNIIVSGLMASHGLLPMGMFELAPVGLPIAAIGLGYMYVLGRGLVPDRIPEQQIEDFNVDLYLTEIIVLPDSPLVGKTLSESGLGRDLDLKAVRLDRGEESLHVLQATTRLHKGDVLLVEGGREDVLRIQEEVGIDVRANIELSDPSLHSEDVGLIEAIVLPGSPLIGRTLKELRFREQFGLQVLGTNHRGETLSRKLGEIRLRMGDLLLLQGDRTQIATLEKRDTFRVLNSIEFERPDKRRALLAIAIFVGVLAAATLDIVSLPVATLLGAMLVFASRCITSEEAYHRVEWRALILIASMLGLGAAMEASGTAEFLSRGILSIVGDAHPVWLLTTFFLLTLLLTQPMSNQAAAVVVLPIAMQAADQLGLNPRSFAMMVALAASCSFLTPLEPACLLVYGPGHYRFLDFLKVGSLLTLLVYLISITLVPLLWPVGPLT
jgi:di/tricarboxylate transporter